MSAARGILLAFVLALTSAGTSYAQNLGQVVSPVLTLDRDRLFSGTLFGQRVNSELEADTAAMATETRKIETALEEEEKSLTEQRATLEPGAFRELALAFDEKVQALRAEREQAQSNLQTRIQTAQTDFFNRVGPILGQLVREKGGVLIIDRRAVLLAAVDVDITDAAIARIDAVIGDGAGAETDGSVADPADSTTTPDTGLAPDNVLAPEAAPVPGTAPTPEAGQ